MLSIDVPAGYGWVVLGAGLAPTITNMYMGGAVMAARKKYDVQYPNLYATPGHHEKADDFNRVQRGHQNYLENVNSYAVMTLLGGLKNPLLCAAGSLCFHVGSVVYLRGYADVKEDAEFARYSKKLAYIKWLGFLASLYSCGQLGVSLIMG